MAPPFKASEEARAHMERAFVASPGGIMSTESRIALATQLGLDLKYIDRWYYLRRRQYMGNMARGLASQPPHQQAPFLPPPPPATQVFVPNLQPEPLEQFPQPPHPQAIFLPQPPHQQAPFLPPPPPATQVFVPNLQPEPLEQFPQPPHPQAIFLPQPPHQQALFLAPPPPATPLFVPNMEHEPLDPFPLNEEPLEDMGGFMVDDLFDAADKVDSLEAQLKQKSLEMEEIAQENRVLRERLNKKTQECVNQQGEIDSLKRKFLDAEQGKRKKLRADETSENES